MHYIITFNLLLQFTPIYSLSPLLFYHFIALYIRGCIYNYVYFNSFLVHIQSHFVRLQDTI